MQRYIKFQYKRFILDFMEKIFLTDTPSVKIFKSLKRKISGVKCKIPDFDTDFTLYFENSARIIKKCLEPLYHLSTFFYLCQQKTKHYYQLILFIMKKLSFLLMSLCLLLCVSCGEKKPTESPANMGDNTEIEATTTTSSTESTPKYEGSPAYVEIMTYFDNTEAQLENCNLEQYQLIHKMTYETVLAKYGEDDITPEENEELRVRYGQFVEKVAEKAKDFGMAE